MVKKVLLALFLAFTGILLLVNGKVLATKEGYVDCGVWDDVTETCSNCDYNAETCEDGCTAPSCDCGSNCPVATPTPVPGATPTPTPGGGGGGSNDPMGWHDGSSCTRSSGWTCDADSYSTALTVKFYTDSARTNYVGETIANKTREQAVADNCGGKADHGFSFTTPASLKDGASHSIYAYAINTGGGSDKLLDGSPKSITCAPSTSTCTVTSSAVCNVAGTQITTSWNVPSKNFSINQVEGRFNKTPMGDWPTGSGDQSLNWGTAISGINVANITGNTDYSTSVAVYKDAPNAARDNYICKSTSTTVNCPTPLPVSAWWQVKDADVMTNESLGKTSNIPFGKMFEIDGLGGFPGVPVYKETTDLTASKVSSKGWLAKSGYVAPNDRIYNYDFFDNLRPAETVINTIGSSPVAGRSFTTGGTIDLNSGYYWYKYQSSLPLTVSSAINLTGSRKVILLVDSPNLYIKGNITYTSGQGFFMVIAKGSINIDPAVASLMGFYLADSNFSSGHVASGDDTPLYVKGSVSAYGSVNLQRDLGASNSTTPGETFEFSPSDIFTYPPQLSIERTRWKEVAP